MKKILLILVGGTICTALNDEGTLSVSEKAGSMLTENFYNCNSDFKDEVIFECSENLFILSENMTVDKWNIMIETYRKLTENKSYDGIIFAHGTDTLAFSASLFSMLLSGTKTPVFFVSANKRLDLPESNGNENFRCATECVCNSIEPNVYVCYKNISDSQMYIHLASRLEQCKNYSEDFYSKGAIRFDGISSLEKIKKEFPCEQTESLIDITACNKLSECVLWLQPYVGINYDAYDYSRFSAVLHGSFHSGTACCEKTKVCADYGNNSILKMIDKCTWQDVYFSPSELSGEIYETVDIIGNHISPDGRKARFLYGFTNETAYAKLLIAYSLFDDENKRDEFINTQCNFEIIN